MGLYTIRDMYYKEYFGNFQLIMVKHYMDSEHLLGLFISFIPCHSTHSFKMVTQISLQISQWSRKLDLGVN